MLLGESVCVCLCVCVCGSQLWLNAAVGRLVSYILIVIGSVVMNSLKSFANEIAQIKCNLISNCIKRECAAGSAVSAGFAGSTAKGVNIKC